MYEIIDVSRYQHEVDWPGVKKSGIHGAMLKTVSTSRRFGGVYIDPYFEANYAGASAAGLPVGVYYYTYATSKAAADKELAMLKTALAGKELGMPVAIDVEDGKLAKLPPQALTDLVLYAARTLESWGVYVMIYTYLSFQRAYLNISRLSNYDLWLAAYRKTRPVRPAHGMWQYTSKGQVNGIQGNVDISHAYKNYPEIIRGAGLTKIKSEIL